jgi:O-antigen/teichoic acid export membrane protein
MSTPTPPPESISKTSGRAESVVSGSMTIVGGQIAIKIIAIVFNIVVIRYLGSEQYGKFAICVAFGGLFAVLSDLGLAPLAVKRVARDRSTAAEMFSNFVVLRVLLAGVVVLLTTSVAWFVGYESDIRLGIFIAALGLISYAFFGLTDAVAIGFERFRVSATLNVGNQMVIMALAGLLVFSGAGFLGLLAAATVGPLIVSLVGIRFLNRDTPLRAPLAPRLWSGMLRSALPFAAIGLALAISYKADMVILSAFTTASLIGLYAVAYNLVFTVVSISHSINLALFPILTREQAASPERARVLFQQGMRYLLFISLPFAVFMTFNARGIVTLLYGEQFAGAATALAILCWVIPLMYLAEFLGYVVIVLDRESVAARSNWVSALSNVGGNLALIPLFGVIAAAVVTVVTEILLVGQYVHALRGRGVFVNAWQTIGRTVCAALLLGFVLLLMRDMGLHVSLVGLVAVGAYLGVATGVGAIGRYEVRLVRSLVVARLWPSRYRETERRRYELQEETTQ